MKIANNQSNVLIVGAGPVGLALACQLNRYGIPARLVEKRASASQHSKALSINAASLQLLKNMQIVDRFLIQGKKVKHIYVHWNNKRLMHINYGRLESPYQYFLSLPQFKSEKILSDHLIGLGGEIERGVELTDALVQEDFVSVLLKHADGKLERAKCNYVIACDGAKSNVRQQVGMPFNGHDYGINFRLIDVFIDWNGAIEDTHYFVKDDGFIIVIPMAGGFHRIVIKQNQQDANQPEQVFSLQLYQELVHQYGPVGIRLKKIIWESIAPFYNRLIENYSYKKRIFFAGDAAHLFSPIGGMGLNTGLQDINNLAWKLAGVIKKGWNVSILDSYNEERRYAAGLLVNSTDESTRLIARIERGVDKDIINWLPLMQNRENIRLNYPNSFSGLIQQYKKNDFVVDQSNCDSTPSLVGCRLPYVKCRGYAGKNFNSHDLITSSAHLLLFGACNNIVTSIASCYGFNLSCIYSHKNNTPPLFVKNSQLIFDPENQLKNKLFAKDGDVFLIRPDGFIGFRGKLENINNIKNYLSNWYEKVI